MERVTFARTIAFKKFGTAIAARMPIIATTISNSISVNPERGIAVLLFREKTRIPQVNSNRIISPWKLSIQLERGNDQGP